jgi:nitroimidazol reductase NimA-like FMN-containing flavoprotein (pyridoxamine 5'-phosphate oxidase superfamily)
LYFHCAPEGKKLEFFKENSRVWGQALLDFGVTEECDYAYTSVHFSGRMSLIEDLGEKQHAMEVLVRQVSLNPEAKLSKIKPERLENITMGRIDLDYMSGKTHQSPKSQV